MTAIAGTIIAHVVLLLYIVGGMEARSSVGHIMPPDAVLGRHVCTSDKFSLDKLVKVQVSGVRTERQVASFSPFRITPVLMEPIDSLYRDKLTSPSGPLMRVVNYLEKTLRVRSIQGNLKIPPSCDEYTYGVNDEKCRVLHTTTECGIFTVSSQYLGTREVCPYSTSTTGCYQSGPNGVGAANTDFLLFVGTKACSFLGTLAFAASCAMDDWLRPSAGFINLCTSSLNAYTEAEKIDSILFQLILHEISHALGFSSSNLQYFHDGNLNLYRPDAIRTYDGSSITVLTSPKVVAQGRQYFGCSDLPYVPLENNGGSGSASSHWESRVLHHETMAPFLSNDYNVMSNFTLAFFEDSGWYEVNYTFANSFVNDQLVSELQWGRGLGCDFVLQSCQNSSSYPYLCDDSIIHRCTFDRLSKGRCRSDYIFFDGCPVILSEDSTSCLHGANIPVPNYNNEVFGANSICVEVNETTPSDPDCLPIPGMGIPQCHPRQLVKDNGTDELAFNITINGETYWCRGSELIRSAEGLLFCPSLDEVLLRVSQEDAVSVDGIPVPDIIYIYNMSLNSTTSTPGSGNDSLSKNFSTKVALPSCTPMLESGCIYGSIQLVGGSNQYEGTVQLCKNDEWGTVCDYRWDSREAQVVCRQLGYDYDGALAYSNAYFGQGTGSVLLTYLYCSGSEDNLLDCSSSTSTSYYCNGHRDDAGVRCPGPCENGEVRLVNGQTSSRGVVEVCVNGEFAIVCADHWDNMDASVVCTEQGYSPYGAIASVDTFLPRATLHARAVLNCTGGEHNLIDCVQEFQLISSCAPFGTATAVCLDSDLPDAMCTDGNIRLKNGYIEGEGRVEICKNRAWGTICDNGWDRTDASVVCRQLGFYPIGIAKSYNFFGSGRGPILLENVQCSGLESSVLDCESDGLGITSCSHFEDAGVICEVNPPIPTVNCTLGDVRLVNGSSVMEGRVEVCFGDLWGSVCGTNWDNREAGVLCYQLFNSTAGGLALNSTEFGVAEVPAVLTNLGCNGTEDKLADCVTSTGGLYSNLCSVGDTAVICNMPVEEYNVSCQDREVRLTNGLTLYEGRVEICFNNTWGAVCSSQTGTSSFGVEEAAVVCRQVGLIPIGVEAFTGSYFGASRHKSYLDVLYCAGHESSILDCVVNNTTQLLCQDYQEVGVRCSAPRNECIHGEIRLANGPSAYEGRIELCFHGTWSGLCADFSFRFDSRDAAVACQQLGYYGLGAIPRSYGYYGKGNGPIWFSGLGCSGNESSLLHCSYSLMSTCYNDYSHAGVQCPQPTNITCVSNGDIRLVGGSSSLEGRVEVCYNNQWGTVCDDSWGSTDARVACRQLGHASYGAQAYSYSRYGGGTGGIFLDNMYCSGTESRLIDCRHNGIGVHNCDHTDDAGVRCIAVTSGSCMFGDIQLVGGSNSLEGRVEVCYDSQWGTVCDDYWGSTDASVACRQLGFSSLGSTAYSNAHFGQGVGNIILDDVACIGSETQLIYCGHRGFGIHNCNHYEDAGVRCIAVELVNCTYGDVRLVGGSAPNKGRVEICINRSWGTICDTSWDSRDATVVCRQLGLPTLGAISFTNAHFGYGTGVIWLDDLRCFGTESALVNCAHDGIGVYASYCGHDDDVAVECPAVTSLMTCTHGEIRLVGGSSSLEGRVEVCYNNQWGTVCDDSWGSTDASVACRQLGLPSSDAIAYSYSYFGEGTGGIFLDNMYCSGTESRLIDCRHNGIGVHNCDHTDDAGVRCRGEVINIANCTYGDVRLVGGSASNKGRVEICISRSWGTICDTFWDSRDATVVCRQLGFPSLGAISFTNAHFGQGTGNIWLDDLRCLGTESTLLSCSHDGIGVYGTFCGHDDDVGVECPTVRITCTHGDIRLVGGSSSLEGRVEVCYNNQWGTVCDDSWGSIDANVACGQLGFRRTGALAYSYSRYGGGTGGIFMDNVYCRGTESRLIDCTHNGIGVHNCDHTDDAGVRCSTDDISSCSFGEIRLVGGSSSLEGRVEVCYNNQWGTVCDDSWGYTDANVACEQLGFSGSGATAYTSAYFGQGTGPILLDDMACTGSESRLVYCSHRGIGIHDCSHAEDAGVRCRAGGTVVPPLGDITTVSAPIQDNVVISMEIDFIGEFNATVKDVLVSLELFITDYCSNDICTYVDTQPFEERKRSLGVDIQVVSVHSFNNGSVYIEFYVTTPNGVLSALSLELAIQEAGSVLSESGVILHSISVPTPTPQRSHQNTTAIAAGVTVGVVVLISIGIILACVGWRFVIRTSRPIEPKECYQIPPIVAPPQYTLNNIYSVVMPNINASTAEEESAMQPQLPLFPSAPPLYTQEKANVVINTRACAAIEVEEKEEDEK